jgi:hypothetical protein
LEGVWRRATPESFATAWLREQQLDWAAELIDAEQHRRNEQQIAATEALA